MASGDPKWLGILVLVGGRLGGEPNTISEERLNYLEYILCGATA